MSTVRKKAVCNWSGGKDSALALLKAIRSGEYDIEALLTAVNRDIGSSTMHNIPETVLRMQSESIGIPLHTVGLSRSGDMGDYAAAMREAVLSFKSRGVTHFIFGDIFMSDIRSYRERQLAPYGIEVTEPLWGGTPQETMEEFLASGLKTAVIATMAERMGKEYIGRTIDRDFVDSLPEDVDICGENGEYHTLCYDGPVFGYPVPFELGEPFLFSTEVGMEDGTKNTYSCWLTDIRQGRMTATGKKAPALQKTGADCG